MNVFSSVGNANEVSFTQQDREMLIRLDEGQKAINNRIDDVNKRIDDLRNLIYVVLAGIFALIGFVLWDTGGRFLRLR